MINSKEKLKHVLDVETLLYLGKISSLKRLKLRFTNEFTYWIWAYVKSLRYCEYYLNGKGISSKIFLAIQCRKKNRLGMRLEIEIHENCFEEGLYIYHGNIVVNSSVRCGKNCKLHGMNCIGNKGIYSKVPVIGDNVEFGFGSGAFGDIKISSGCIVGANAIVVKSQEKEKSVLVGIPATCKK